MSDEYIRKADAIDEVNHALDRETILFSFVRKVAISALKKLPSADVVQVVRCKDCEWAMKSTELPGWYMCKCEEAFDYYAKPDDFCSHGERRE